MPSKTQSWSEKCSIDSHRRFLREQRQAYRHCRVSPGRSWLSQARRPTSRLMTADLPTFGNPTTAARTGRGLSPLLARWALMTSPTRPAAPWRRGPARSARQEIQDKLCFAPGYKRHQVVGRTPL